MIFRRIKAHVAKEDWFAVFVDFCIVVFGVFMGFQVQAWNEGRKETERSFAYLHRIADDIDSDIQNYRDRIKFWGDVEAYGKNGLNYAETGQAGDTSPWQLLLGYFQASQVAEFMVSSSTYDELKSASELNLIKNPDLRVSLAAYYNFEAAEALQQRPIYRDHIRGKIPIDIQSYIWRNCWLASAEGLQELIDCPSPVDEALARKLVEDFSKNRELMEELRYWTSMLEVSGLIAETRISEAAIVLQLINENITTARKIVTP